jgi:hypothetical protein
MVCVESSKTNALTMRSKLLEQLATSLQQGNVVLLDPIASLCDAKVCRLAEAGEANFRDISHLSHTASLRFTPDIRVALAALAAPVIGPAGNAPTSGE